LAGARPTERRSIPTSAIADVPSAAKRLLAIADVPSAAKRLLAIAD